MDGTETHGIKWFVEGQVSGKSRQHGIPFLCLTFGTSGPWEVFLKFSVFLKPENQ